MPQGGSSSRPASFRAPSSYRPNPEEDEDFLPVTPRRPSVVFMPSPGSLESMLKTSTETGDIGIFTIAPRNYRSPAIRCGKRELSLIQAVGDDKHPLVPKTVEDPPPDEWYRPPSLSSHQLQEWNRTPSMVSCKTHQSQQTHLSRQSHQSHHSRAVNVAAAEHPRGHYPPRAGAGRTPDLPRSDGQIHRPRSRAPPRAGTSDPSIPMTSVSSRSRPPSSYSATSSRPRPPSHLQYPPQYPPHHLPPNSIPRPHAPQYTRPPVGSRHNQYPAMSRRQMSSPHGGNGPPPQPPPHGQFYGQGTASPNPHRNGRRPRDLISGSRNPHRSDQYQQYGPDGYGYPPPGIPPHGVARPPYPGSVNRPPSVCPSPNLAREPAVFYNEIVAYNEHATHQLRSHSPRVPSPRDGQRKVKRTPSSRRLAASDTPGKHRNKSRKASRKPYATDNTGLNSGSDWTESQSISGSDMTGHPGRYYSGVADRENSEPMFPEERGDAKSQKSDRVSRAATVRHMTAPTTSVSQAVSESESLDTGEGERDSIFEEQIVGLETDNSSFGLSSSTTSLPPVEANGGKSAKQKDLTLRLKAHQKARSVLADLSTGSEACEGGRRRCSMGRSPTDQAANVMGRERTMDKAFVSMDGSIREKTDTGHSIIHDETKPGFWNRMTVKLRRGKSLRSTIMRSPSTIK